MVDSALEHWVTTFAAGAGSTYVWHLVDDCLVAQVTADLEMCTLTGQATLELGVVMGEWDYYRAIVALKVPVVPGYKVISASDNAFEPADIEMAQLRARLLRICGVQEEDAVA